MKMQVIANPGIAASMPAPDQPKIRWLRVFKGKFCG
jgi:hypothetical protein